MPDVPRDSTLDLISQRQRWMALLAKAPAQMLEETVQEIGVLPDYTLLRAPEPGLVMVQGRAGGSGQRFNLGEMTVTRCAVQLANGIDGHAYVAGRNLRHAELAAVCDALLQLPDRHDELQAKIIRPLAMAHADRRQQAAKTANATKVNFFTMVRGEN